MNALISTTKSGRFYSIDLSLYGDGKEPRRRCIGDDLNQAECKERELAAGAALLLAGYAVENLRR